MTAPGVFFNPGTGNGKTNNKQSKQEITLHSTERFNLSGYIQIVIMFQCVFCGALLAQENLDLQTALNIARENSPQIQQARYNLQENRELLNAQNAALKSRFSLSLDPFTFDRSREFNPFFSTFNTQETRQSGGLFTISQPIKATDGTLLLQNQFVWRDDSSEFQNVRTESFSNNFFLTYRQPLFTYNRTKLDLESVELNLRAADLNYKIQELLLEQQVAQLFYNAFQQRMNYQVAQEDLQNTQQSFDIIERKVAAGLAAKEEAYQAELNLTTNRSAAQNALVALENSLDDLKSLIGMPLIEDISVAAEITHQPVAAELDKAITHGLSARLELRQRQIDIESAQSNLTRQAATNEFSGNLNVTFGYIGTDENFDRIYDNPTQNQNFNLSLEIPIWDWGEKKSRTRAGELGVRRSELSLDEEKTNIAIGIRKAFRNLENQNVQIEIARQNVKVAELTYEINLERYRNGDLTSIDLNQYQTQLSNNKKSLVDALINYKLALLDLKVKSLWDFEQGKAIVFEEE